MGPLILSQLWGQCEDPLAPLAEKGMGPGLEGILHLSPALAVLLWTDCLDTAVHGAAQPPTVFTNRWRVEGCPPPGPRALETLLEWTHRRCL